MFESVKSSWSLNALSWTVHPPLTLHESLQKQELIPQRTHLALLSKRTLKELSATIHYQTDRCWDDLSKINTGAWSPSELLDTGDDSLSSSLCRDQTSSVKRSQEKLQRFSPYRVRYTFPHKPGGLTSSHRGASQQTPTHPSTEGTFTFFGGIVFKFKVLFWFLKIIFP